MGSCGINIEIEYIFNQLKTLYENSSINSIPLCIGTTYQEVKQVPQVSVTGEAEIGCYLDQVTIRATVETKRTLL
jgi:hypothetical protein